jgi:hypothetical protein
MSTRSFTHIINLEIVLHNVEYHSININKQHEIDFKLYTLTLEVGNTLQKHFE